MGMHDIEDIVEWSIRCLAKSRRASETDCRSLFASLYEFQDKFDTGFTHFRIMDLLIVHRFVYVFAVEDHPDYKRLRSHLELPAREWRMDVLRDPTKPWHKTENPEVGYIADSSRWNNDLPPVCAGRKLYADAGSELWRALVAAGKLTGADAAPPRSISPPEVAATVAREAEQQGDSELIRWWLAVLFWHMEESPLEELRANPFVRQLRTIARRVDAMSVEPDEEYGHFRIPREGDSYIPKTAAWWFDLALDTDAPPHDGGNGAGGLRTTGLAGVLGTLLLLALWIVKRRLS